MNHIFKPLLLAGVVLSLHAAAHAQTQTWVTRNADGTTTRTQVTVPSINSQTHGVNNRNVRPQGVHPDDPNRHPRHDHDGNTTIIINNGGGGYYPNGGYGYPGYGYNYPAYQFPYTIPIGPGNPRSPFPPPTITSAPIGGYNPYPGYGYGYPSYPDYGYGYPNNDYGYPDNGYGDYGYGYGYNTQTTGATFSYNRGGVGVTIGGRQTTGTYNGVYTNGGYNGYNGAANFGAPVGGFGQGTVTYGRRRR